VDGACDGLSAGFGAAAAETNSFNDIILLFITKLFWIYIFRKHKR
jgi:hypothetical protein